MSNRDALFNDKTDKGVNGLYSGWEEALISVPTVVDRTVFYDSNIALTDGVACVSTENVKTIPNLYATLEGLNNRISAVAKANDTTTGNSIVGIETSIDDPKNVNMSAVHNEEPHSLTIDAKMISFKFNNGAEYSMENIFAMLEELRARTFAIKTSIKRAVITNNYINRKITIFEPDSDEAKNGSALWIKNFISQQQ